MRLITKHALVGYVTPQGRPCCRNCTFMTGEENGLNQVVYWSCRKHGFEVRTGGICRDHPRAAAGAVAASPARGPHLVDHVKASPVRGVHQVVEPVHVAAIWPARLDQAEASPAWGDFDQVYRYPALLPRDPGRRVSVVGWRIGGECWFQLCHDAKVRMTVLHDVEGYA